jgi:hypothetical protein
VSLGAWAGSVRADDTVIVVPARSSKPTVITLPAGLKAQKQQGTQQKQDGIQQKQDGIQQTSASTDPSVSYDPELKTVRRYPVLEWCADKTRSCGCWADYNSDYNCGSLHSECIFIFGSCRQFWREPCFKSPPPSPFGPAYDCPPGHPWHRR